MNAWEQTELLYPDFFKEFSGGAAAFDADDDFTITNTVNNGTCVVRFANPIKDYQWLELQVQAFDPVGEFSTLAFYRDIDTSQGPRETFGAQVFGQGVTTLKVPYVGELEGFRWSNILGTIKIHSIKAIQRSFSIQKQTSANIVPNFAGWTPGVVANTFVKQIAAGQNANASFSFSNLINAYCYLRIQSDRPFASAVINFNNQNCNANATDQEYYFDGTEVSPKSLVITASADTYCNVTVTVLYAYFPANVSAFGGASQNSQTVQQLLLQPIALLTTNNSWQGVNAFVGNIQVNGTGYMKGQGSANPVQYSASIPVADITGLGTMATANAGDYLARAQNLLELTDPAAARANLGIPGVLAAYLTTAAAAATYAALAGAAFTGAVSVPRLEVNGSALPTNGIYLPVANTLALTTGGSPRWKLENQGPSTTAFVGAFITPATTTTWYRVGTFAAANQAQCADLYFFVSRNLGGGLQQFKVRFSKATPGGSNPGITAKFEHLGSFLGGVFCIAELRIIPGGINAASFLDVRFASAGEMYGIDVQVHNFTATGSNFFVVDPTFTSQGTGAAGHVLNPTLYQEAQYNDVQQGWYYAITHSGSVAITHNLTQTRVVPNNIAGDGVTDDAAAIQATLNNAPNGSTVVLPAGTFRTSFGITVPAYKTLAYEHYGKDATTGQCVILADLAVTPVIQVDGGGASASSALKGITVQRAAGAVPANCIGVNVNGGNDQVIEDVTVYRAAIGFKCTNTLGTMFTRCETTQITDKHIQISNSQEVKFVMCRTGKNGGLDVNCNAYVSITGTSPDTITFTNCQLNQSAGLATYVVSFDNFTGLNGIFTFSQCHMELASNGVGATGTTTYIPRLGFYGCSINLQPGAIFLPNTNALFDQLTVVNNVFIQGTINLVGAVRTTICGNDAIINAVSLDACQGSFSNNNCLSTLTVTGACPGLTVAGNVLTTASAFTDTSTGSVRVYGNTINNAALDAAVLDRLNKVSTRNYGSIIVTQAYSAAITIDAGSGGVFKILANNGTAFTINAPTNPRQGMEMTIRIANISGGALGAVTWDVAFKMAAWTQPANGFNRAIRFLYDSAQWQEISRTPADVPN